MLTLTITGEIASITVNVYTYGTVIVNAFTVTGAISHVSVIVYTNWSVNTNGCYRVSTQEALPSAFDNNKGTSQPLHSRRLASAFVICFWESIIRRLPETFYRVRSLEGSGGLSPI